ncbi:uncharacterized protein CTRU02_206601 [Colletotrichum truncatum]|uniref:Uncharacterized protein n=1 Tax=Colletotrichum truncatum TaxID=5467 RepID=A0ACC3Z7D6_COLTU|nr:uncharacterized protein CTRU02_11970 [Colletotrichum truncatum]KAF6785345.1 hypothetical protein CTRU02_11970 [Colletotrichum truncatum]
MSIQTGLAQDTEQLDEKIMTLSQEAVMFADAADKAAQRGRERLEEMKRIIRMADQNRYKELVLEAEMEAQIAEAKAKIARIAADRAVKRAKANKRVAVAHANRRDRPKRKEAATTKVCEYCNRAFTRNDECRRHLRDKEYPKYFPHITDNEERILLACIDAP